MRFEHVLQIYWTKGFFYGGKLFYFNRSLDDVFEECPGLGKKYKQNIFNRFELKFYNKNIKNRYSLITNFESTSKQPIRIPLNVMLSQVTTVNSRLNEVHLFNLLRYYLTRSYRGKCHALGKPVRGQRTWSNAWGSYKNNKELRSFISEVKKKIKKEERPEKINYRLVEKKYAKRKKINPLVKKFKKKSIWF